MNFQTTDHILWKEDTIELTCSCCGLPLDEHESIDPCLIDGEHFHDSCASSLTTLRLEGYINEVSAKTAKLKHEHENECYYKAYDNINF